MTGPDDRAVADTVVIGGGLAGLLAAITAATAAPARSRVVVLEPHALGGRARCDQRDGFTFNRGPRALYADGIADRALRAVGVDTSTGGKPTFTDPVAIHDGILHRFPGSALDSARTTLFTPRQKVAVSRTLAALWRADEERTEGLSVSAWLDQRGATGVVRQFVEALVRVSTYANAPEVFAAGPALANARAGISPGVRYVDGGWQSLVDQLAALAGSLGVEVRSAAARGIEAEPDGTVAVLHDGGPRIRATSVIVAAGGPVAAIALLGHRPESWRELAPAVTAACLELGLSSPPTHRFALGIDEPLYASTHCPPADLAPEGGAVVHLMRYQPADDDLPATDQQALLHGLAARIGITREQIVTERFLARMVVAGTVPGAATGGLGGRPAVEVPEHPGVLLAGDWVGADGLLLDCVAASATEAGRRAAARSATMVPA